MQIFIQQEILPHDTDVQECTVTATSPLQKKIKLDCTVSVDWRESVENMDFVKGCNVYKHHMDRKAGRDLVDNVDGHKAQSLQAKITPVDTVEETTHGTKEQNITSESVVSNETENFFDSDRTIKSYCKFETKPNDITINAEAIHETNHVDVTNSPESQPGVKSGKHLALQNHQSETKSINFAQGQKKLLLEKESLGIKDFPYQANGESDTFSSSHCTNESGDVNNTISHVSKIIFHDNTASMCQKSKMVTDCLENVQSIGNKVLNEPDEVKLDGDGKISEHVASESIELLDRDRQTALISVKSCTPVCSSEEKSEQGPCAVNHCSIVPCQEKPSVPEVNQTVNINNCGPAEGVVYVHSDEYMQLCDTMIRVPGRVGIVQSLSVTSLFIFFASLEKEGSPLKFRFN